MLKKKSDIKVNTKEAAANASFSKSPLDKPVNKGVCPNCGLLASYPAEIGEKVNCHKCLIDFIISADETKSVKK